MKIKTSTYASSSSSDVDSPWPLFSGRGSFNGTTVKVEGMIFLGFRVGEVHWPNDLSINLKMRFLLNFYNQ